MFSHVMVGTNDLEKAKAFYDALFTSIGGKEAITDPKQADAWHAAGVAAGGTPIEDPPGWREGGGMKLYLAYLRDPDGNKICAMCRG